MKWIKRILFFFAFLYFLLCVGLYFGQEKLLFYPHTLDADYKPWKGEEVWISTPDNIRLNAALVKQSNPKGAILYFHGNKGSLKRCLAQIRQFENIGYDVLVLDYRTYGKSEGQLEGEQQMYDDAQLAYDFLAERYDDIVIVGYSMGSGLASYIASNNPTKALLLVAPYVSLIDMKNRYLPFIPNFLLKYHFRTDFNLAQVTCPTILVHGERDEVIPVDSSRKLGMLHPKVEVMKLPGVSHRRVIFHNKIQEAMTKILNL